MCDYSLHNVEMRPAKVGDQLRYKLWHRHTRIFRIGGCKRSSLFATWD